MIDLSRAPKTLRTNAPKPWHSSGPKLWRIRGKARDGLVVTLGRYETEPEAQTDLQRLIDCGNYRNLKLEAINPAAPSAAPPLNRGRRPATRAG
jgi:hypothetical protein